MNGAFHLLYKMSSFLFVLDSMILKNNTLVQYIDYLNCLPNLFIIFLNCIINLYSFLLIHSCFFCLYDFLLFL